MHILQLVGIGLTATVLVTLLRPHVPQFAFALGILAGAIMLLMVVNGVDKVIATLSDLAAAAKVDQGILATVLKIIGIAYLVEFAAQIARDASEGGLASKIELAGKVGIVVLAVPIITDVVSSLVHLLP